jgi:hypothetical protein
MSIENLWRAQWLRGLLFGAAIGAILGILGLIFPPSPAALAGRARPMLVGGGGGVKTLGPTESHAGPEFSAREESLLRVAQEYSNKGMWSEAEKVFANLAPGPARDLAIARNVQSKIEFRQNEIAALSAKPDEARQWITSLAAEVEGMGASLAKVESLIKLAKVRSDVVRGVVLDPGAPPADPAKAAAARSDAQALALLTRAGEVARTVPEDTPAGESWVWLRPLLMAGVFGLFGMGAAWITANTNSRHRHQVEPESVTY